MNKLVREMLIIVSEEMIADLEEALYRIKEKHDIPTVVALGCLEVVKTNLVEKAKSMCVEGEK